MNAQWLLIAGEPYFCSAIVAASLDFHVIELFLKLLSVLLDLLGLAESFSELTEIWKSEPCHDGFGRACRLSGCGEAEPFHFRMKDESMGLLNALLDKGYQCIDICGGGPAAVDDEVGVNGRHFSSSDAGSLQP